MTSDETTHEEAEEFHRAAETLIEQMERVGARTIGELFEIRRRQSTGGDDGQ